MTKPLFTEKQRFSDWDKLCSFVNELARVKGGITTTRWVFRGLSDYEYDKEGMTSSFDRELATGTSPKQRLSYERLMLYQFKRRAHHYLGSEAIPEREDFLEWFGLMRHWGVPSRLVDFSYSFFVATYFAISGARKDAAVFCVDHTWLVELVNGSIEDGEYFQNPAVFWKYAVPDSKNRRPLKPMVVPVRPFRSNDRVHAQQGLFLCPTDVTKTFDENLRDMMKAKEIGAGEAKKHILKLRIGKSLCRKILPELRAMNISYETLYPGLEGFGRSMKDLLAMRLRRLDEDLAEALLREKPPF